MKMRYMVIGFFVFTLLVALGVIKYSQTMKSRIERPSDRYAIQLRFDMGWHHETESEKDRKDRLIKSVLLSRDLVPEILEIYHRHDVEVDEAELRTKMEIERAAMIAAICSQ